MDFRSFIDGIDNPFAEPAGDIRTHAEELPPQVEIAIDKNGRPRQAGADLPEGKFIVELRERAEQNLFVFTKGILNRSYLSPTLHTEVARWAQRREIVRTEAELTTAALQGKPLQRVNPAYRKLLLLPRNHAKTSIISHGLPCHLLIQPKENNIYLPGRAGVDTRIMLAGETERRAANNLSVIQAAFEGNRLLRALWPQCCWENPRKEAPKWNKIEIVLPRTLDYPDPTIQAIGVGGAITGARHDVHIKDDLVSFEAANSVVVMETAIAWHLASRALLDNDNSLEFIIGTRWAVHDLYDVIINGGIVDGEKFDKDPTVDVVVRSIVEDGKVIYPEKFAVQTTPGKISVTSLMKEHGTMFPLLYMNSAADPSLVDFDMDEVRGFAFKDGEIVFDEDERDVVISERANATHNVKPDTQNLRGMPLNKDTHDIVFARQSMMMRPQRGVKSA